MRRLVRPAAIAALVLGASLALLAAWPDYDIGVARLFYDPAAGGFVARFNEPLIRLRDAIFYLPILVMVLAALGWVARLPALASVLTARRLVFLIGSLALGPGLVVNVVLKDISHRPRPAQIVEFGGQSAFRPWYAFDGTCGGNCSFASGEVSGAAWLVAPAALLPPPLRALAIGAAVVVTAGTGVLRIAFGGHFASDVIGGALVTLLAILLVGWAVFAGKGRGSLT